MQARTVEDREQWNRFVAAAQSGGIQQSYEWGELGQKYLGESVLRVGVFDSAENMIGAALVLIEKIPGMSMSYFYIPRGPVLVAPHESDALKSLTAFLKESARKYKAIMCRVEPNVPDKDVQWLDVLVREGYRESPYITQVRSEWVLNIEPDEEQILAQMKEKWRYNIRLASRKGVQIREGSTDEDVEAFYKLYIETSARDQFFIHPQAYYEDFLHLFGEGDHARLFIAEFEGAPIAACICAWFGHRAWYMFGASTQKNRAVMPNHLLQWTAMRWAKSKGCSEYNFRGIPVDLKPDSELWGVYKFKQGFGGYAYTTLMTHDYIFRPVLYKLYLQLIGMKRNVEETRRAIQGKLRKAPAPSNA